jgi:NADPH:quinone reductase-like Zn-dependent oxidoreductase
MQINESAEGLILQEAEVARPKPGRGEILICVHAAGVTPTELRWYPTTHAKSGEPRVHAIPGHEFSGVIAEVGEGVSGLATGQEVYGMNDWFEEGATAEYCVTLPSSVAPKPASLTHVEAATVPIGALTAWQGLFDRAQLKQRERALVHGGAGAVGVFAVQLAHLHGAYVIATASAKNCAFVKELGADEVIDYETTRFEEVARDIDVVFDTVGGETRERSWKALKADGRMISIAADGEVTTNPKVRDAYFIVKPDKSQLIEVAKLLDSGRLKTFVKAVVPLGDAAAAYAGKLQPTHRYGKVVIAVTDDKPSQRKP